MAKRDMSGQELFALVREHTASEIAIMFGVFEVAVGTLCKKFRSLPVDVGTHHRASGNGPSMWITGLAETGVR